jgi:hypothetical protein
MGVRRGSEQEGDRPRQKPATTLEGREKQLVAKAVDLAERQLEDGTASAQVISFYLKLGSTREILEQERLRHENDLLQAKTESLASQARMEEIYSNAIKALGIYSGREPSEGTDSDED